MLSKETEQLLAVLRCLEVPFNVTRSELAAATGKKTAGGISEIMSALKKAGLIDYTAQRGRGYSVTRVTPKEEVGLSLAGLSNQIEILNTRLTALEAGLRQHPAFPKESVFCFGRP
jgi:SOS-response transcriptional repressor LexA